MRDAQARTIYLKDYRVPDFLIDSTDLHFDLYEDHAVVSARLGMRRNPEAEAGAPLVLHGQDMQLLKVSVNGRQLADEEYNLAEESLQVNLPVEAVPDTFEFYCQTRIEPQNNTSLEGLYKSKSMFCTQCEAEGFRKITYYLDRPDVLSAFTTTIVADREKYPVLLSNGNETGRGICDTDSSRHWVRWQDPFRKPSYLFALVAGRLSPVSDTFTTCSGREISLQIFVEEKDLDKCDFAMGALKRAMRWDEEVYGREYDLDVFMIVAVDDFNMGAMENKGLNIFNSSCVLANPATSTDVAFQRIEAIVAHEYFHNWSGNRVTCRDWFQLSLKEGFTVYRDSEFSADMGSRAVKRIEDVNMLRTVQFPEDAGPMAHPVRPASYMEISNFYTVTIYEKGAEVVRMQAELLGPELFRKGTDLYFERYDGQAVTTEDFISTMEEISGQDLQQFRRWYTQAGTPRLTVREEWDAAVGSYVLEVEQSCPATPGQTEKAPFHIPLRMGLLGSDGRELPLQLRGENDAAGTTRVLQLCEERERFEFVGLEEKPVPSLLRGFSAPVKIHMDYSREQLLFLMSHDSDGFVRWEAGQQLCLQIMDDLLKARQEGRVLTLDRQLTGAFDAVLRTSLEDRTADKAMLAHLLLLPSESYVGDQYDVVDVDGIHEVRQFIRRQLAEALSDRLADVYEANSPGEAYVFNGEAVAARALRNTALNYLLLLEDERWISICDQQFSQADNMTDTSAALRALINNPGPLVQPVLERALEAFYQQWQHEPLVVDQWLGMQAGANVPDNLNKVQALMHHPCFDIRNPNKVRALIGSFTVQNLVGFHRTDGSAYLFLADRVLELDILNPQIAARILGPLTRWNRHQPQRQALMKAQLERIMTTENLSRDVYEVVSKSLQ